MCPKWQLLESAYGKNIQVFSVVFLYSFPNTLISYISYFSSLNHMANFFWILLISSESQGILKVSRSFCFHSAAFDWFSNWETQRLEGGRRGQSISFSLLALGRLRKGQCLFLGPGQARQKHHGCCPIRFHHLPFVLPAWRVADSFLVFFLLLDQACLTSLSFHTSAMLSWY